MATAKARAPALKLPAPELGPQDLAYHPITPHFADLVHELQGNAGSPADGFEAAFSAAAAAISSFPHVLSTLDHHLATATAELAGLDADTGNDVAQMIDQGLRASDATEGPLAASVGTVAAIAKGIKGLPNTQCSAGYSTTPPPSTPSSSPGPAIQSALWKIYLGSQILSVPMVPAAAAWSGGAGLGGTALGGTLAAFLPIVSGAALGAVLPLAILKVFFGIDPFSQAATAGEIAQIKATADSVLTPMLADMEAALKYARPGSAPAVEVQRSYQIALGFLERATCYVLSYTDPREYQWSADWLTKYAQGWTKALGTYPPAVSCPGH